jgi:RNA polymerase sigma-70 factor (ECF subfamily)
MSYFYRRVANHADAQDLTQQVFLRLVASGHVSDLDNAAAYVFTVAANLLKDRHRSQRVTPQGILLPPGDLIDKLIVEAMEDRSPERVLLAKEALADVLRALDELGEKTRDIFILFRLENMKQRDIAALYGIGQSTVEKHVVKATLHLSRKYRPK